MDLHRFLVQGLDDLYGLVIRMPLAEGRHGLGGLDGLFGGLGGLDDLGGLGDLGGLDGLGGPDELDSLGGLDGLDDLAGLDVLGAPGCDAGGTGEAACSRSGAGGGPKLGERA